MSLVFRFGIGSSLVDDITNQGTPGTSKNFHGFFELAGVLVRLDHVASGIVNADF
jgi:hypothetical protein